MFQLFREVRATTICRFAGREAPSQQSFHSDDQIGCQPSSDIGEQGFLGLGACLDSQSFEHRNAGNNNSPPAHLVGKGCDDVPVFRRRHGHAASESKQIGAQWMRQFGEL